MSKKILSNRLDVHILKGSVTDKKQRNIEFCSSTIAVGRQSVSCSEDMNAIDFPFDPKVSREHASLTQTDGFWNIEDVGSANGTLLDGVEIRGAGPVNLVPGVVIQTGDTLWTIVPPGWLFFVCGDVAVIAPYNRMVSYVFSHCAIPVVGNVTIRNFGGTPSPPTSTVFEITGYAEPSVVNLPPLLPGAKTTIGPPGLVLCPDVLHHQVNPQKSAIRARLSGRTEWIWGAPVTILGFESWPYQSSALRTLPAFVCAHDLLIERIVFEAEDFNSNREERILFRQILASASDNAVECVVERLYRFFCEKTTIYYENPQLKTSPESSDLFYQVLKKPSSIFAADPQRFLGKATCIDLTLLMASCFERIGIFPVLILTGNRAFHPDHCFVGCHTGTLPGAKPIVYDQSFLLREVGDGNLIAVECTGFTDGSPHGNKLSLNDAKKKALEQVKDAPWICMIDVGALRPPEGTVTPIEYSFEPVVISIYNHTMDFAKMKLRRGYEARFLLYGLLSAEGEVIKWILSQLRLDTQDLRNILDCGVEIHDHRESPIPTETFLECQQLAQRFAWRAGVSSVREQDILWAFLEKGRINVGIKKICALCGIDIDKAITILSVRCPRPFILQSTVVTEFS